VNQMSQLRPAAEACPAGAINLQFRVKPPNEYDHCLLRETDFWRAVVRAGGIGCVAQGRKGPVYDPARPPWITMPSQAVRYQKMGSILLPAVEGVDNLVLSFRVPANYDAVIRALVGIFVPVGGGLGLAEGSGDLVWRLQTNSVYVKDYGAVTTSLGDLSSPHSFVGGGIRLRANSLVRCWVRVGVGGLANLDPLGRIICIVMGWNYPAP